MDRTTLELSYAVFKQVWTTGQVVYWTKGSDGSYRAFFTTDTHFLRCAVLSSEAADFEAQSFYSASGEVGSEDDARALGFYVANANKPLATPDFRSARIKRFFGNKTTAANSEVLVANAYTEQASQAQRSLVSTSANDASAGSGARVVRVEYLNSNYDFAIEDVTMNGTTPVNTVSTTIRFVQAMYVIAGTAAAGTITMKSTTGGGGTDVCVIASATESAFLCHYYCPSNKTAWIIGWGTTVDDETSMRLKSQTRINDLLVDTNFDLEKLFNGNPTPPVRLSFERTFLGGAKLAAKTYTRVTTQPNQNTSTVHRSWLYILEEP